MITEHDLDAPWEPVSGPMFFNSTLMHYRGSTVRYIDGVPHVLKPEFCKARRAASIAEEMTQIIRKAKQ